MTNLTSLTSGARQDFKKPEERALGFAYTFLGVRIQCAQCHKHPFDQWTKDDFDRFKNFFNRVTEYRNGTRYPDERSTYKQMLVSLDIDTTDKDLKGNKLYRLLRTKAIRGKTVPFYRNSPNQSQTSPHRGKAGGDYGTDQFPAT